MTRSNSNDSEEMYLDSPILAERLRILVRKTLAPNNMRVLSAARHYIRLDPNITRRLHGKVNISLFGNRSSRSGLRERFR